MILRHFNLREQPFGVTPDPRYLFATETHREALAAVLYGIESGLGFIALTANPGMGKTTILFEALARLGERARTVFIFQAVQTPTDLLRALLIDLGEIDPQGSLVDLETRLNEILVQQSETGKRLVVVVDEAQNLDTTVLEAVRMLSNFETTTHKLMQIVLSGQLQLADRLAEPGLLQLRQRISIFAYLKPLSAFEVAEYIDHRLKIAGYSGSKPIFTPEATALIVRHSGGIPRNVNNLCFNALSLGCALQRSAIDANIVREVVADLKVQRELPPQIAIGEPEPVQLRPRLGARVGEAWPGLRVGAIAAAIFFVIALAAGTVFLKNPAVFGAASKAADKVLPDQSPAPASQLQVNDPAPAPPAATPVQASAQDAASQPAPSADSAVQASEPQAPAPPTARRRKRAAATRHRHVPIASTEVRLVEAREGQSLLSICSEHFGESRPPSWTGSSS